MKWFDLDLKNVPLIQFGERRSNIHILKIRFAVMEITSYRLHNSNKVMIGLVKKAPVGFYQPLGF